MSARYILPFVLLLALVLAWPLSSFAQSSQDVDIRYETVNPKDGTKYTLKRLKEKIFLLVLSPFSSKKADYFEELLDARLAELKFVVDNKDMANFQLATQRYSATAGQYTEFLVKKKLNERKEKAVGLLKTHLPVIEKLKGAFNDTTAEWRFVKQDEDYLKIYISQLEK